MADNDRHEPHLVNAGPGGNLDLDNIFSYHAPTPEQIEKYQDIRDCAKELAALIGDLVPPSPERTKAIQKVRGAVMWANAGIACNTKKPTADG